MFTKNFYFNSEIIDLEHVNEYLNRTAVINDCGLEVRCFPLSLKFVSLNNGVLTSFKKLAFVSENNLVFCFLAIVLFEIIWINNLMKISSS